MSSIDEDKGQPIAFSLVQLVGLISVLLFGIGSVIAMPFNIGGIVVEFGASKGDAGLVATIELASVSLSSIAVAQMVDKFDRRLLALIGLVIGAIGNGLTLTAETVESMYYLRAIGGVGAGTTIAAVMATAAQSDNPEMTFGWINGAVGIALVILSLSVPPALTTFGLDGAYGVYLVCAIFAVPMLLLFPQGQPARPRGRTTSEGGGGLIGFLALVGFGGVFLAHGGVLLFAERIGAGIDMSVEQVGYALSIGGFLTIIGPVAAGAVGARFGTMGPVILAGTLLIAIGYLVTNASGPAMFFSSVPVFMVVPLALLPIFLGGLSVLDPTGKLAASHAAFVTMGGALGPVITGRIADHSGFSAVGWFAIAVFFIGIVLMTLAARRADQIRSRHPQH